MASDYKVPHAITIAPRSLALTLGKDVASTLTSTDYKGVQAVTYALPGNWIGRKPENGGNQVEPFVELSPCQTATDVHAVVAISKNCVAFWLITYKMKRALRTIRWARDRI